MRPTTPALALLFLLLLVLVLVLLVLLVLVLGWEVWEGVAWRVRCVSLRLPP